MKRMEINIKTGLKSRAAYLTMVLALATFASPVTQAAGVSEGGREGGNGGRVVSCPERIYMLDTYEGLRRGLVSNLDDHASVRTNFNTMNSRIGKFLPVLAKTLAQEAEPFLTDVENYWSFPVQGLPAGNQMRLGSAVLWTTDLNAFISDTGKAWQPGGECKEQQLIVEHDAPLKKEDREFGIYLPTWETMLKSNITSEIAIAVMHEILYKHTRAADRAAGKTEVDITSFNARYMNQYLMSDKLSSLSLCEYMRDVHSDTFAEITAPGPKVTCNRKGEFESVDMHVALYTVDHIGYAFLTSFKTTGNDSFELNVSQAQGAVYGFWERNTIELSNGPCEGKRQITTKYDLLPTVAIGTGDFKNNFADILKKIVFKVRRTKINHKCGNDFRVSSIVTDEINATLAMGEQKLIMSDDVPISYDVNVDLPGIFKYLTAPVESAKP